MASATNDDTNGSNVLEKKSQDGRSVDDTSVDSRGRQSTGEVDVQGSDVDTVHEGEAQSVGQIESEAGISRKPSVDGTPAPVSTTTGSAAPIVISASEDKWDYIDFEQKEDVEMGWEKAGEDVSEGEREAKRRRSSSQNGTNISADGVVREIFFSFINRHTRL